MNFQQHNILCPKCGESISIDDVLTRQIENTLRKEMEETKRKQELDIRARLEDVEMQKRQLETDRVKAQSEIEKRVSEKIEAEKRDVRKVLQEEFEKEQRAEKKMLEDRLAEKDQKLREASEKELELRKEKNKLEEERKNFELEKQRQLDAERKNIAEEAGKKASEEQQYVIAQLKKQLTDATKAKDDLARKLEQGSQQLQGEVLELELENMLRSTFIFDDIAPVPKGVNGADIIQEVKDRSGRMCGRIAWESKQTKTWNEGWIQKLKDDQRAVRADVAVIVSAVLPDDISGFGFRDGVWICDVKLASALASALRINLESVAREKMMAVGKNEKMEILYAYLTGVEFRQRVEAIVEAFSDMQDGLKKERMAYEKMWSQREKNLQKVMINTVGMYGDLSGMVPLPQIRQLELETGDDRKEKSRLL